MAEDTQSRRVLLQAAEAARFAPSIHNTQPWRWVVHADRLELFAATDRQLAVQDPNGRMLLISCGAAVHHACVALDAEGWQYRVDRPADSPLAVLHPAGHAPIDPAATRHFEQLRVRHTDRRTVGDDPVDPAVLQVLAEVATRSGTRLHMLSRDQVIELAVLVEQAHAGPAHTPRLPTEQVIEMVD